MWLVGIIVQQISRDIEVTTNDKIPKYSLCGLFRARRTIFPNAFGPSLTFLVHFQEQRETVAHQPRCLQHSYAISEQLQSSSKND